ERSAWTNRYEARRVRGVRGRGPAWRRRRLVGRDGTDDRVDALAGLVVPAGRGPLGGGWLPRGRQAHERSATGASDLAVRAKRATAFPGLVSGPSARAGCRYGPPYVESVGAPGSVHCCWGGGGLNSCLAGGRDSRQSRWASSCLTTVDTHSMGVTNA